MLVFNKVDRLPPGEGAALAHQAGGVAISAATRDGLSDLLHRCDRLLWDDGRVAFAEVEAGAPARRGRRRPSAGTAEGLRARFPQPLTPLQPPGATMSAPAASPPAPVKEFKPYVAAETTLAELTPKAVVTGAIFGIIFGASTVYLALKAGLTVSASIPIAVIAISLGRKFLKTTILENNIIQTAGSAGESIAAGVVFTLPGFLFLSTDAHHRGLGRAPATSTTSPSSRWRSSAASSACS